MVRWYGCLVIFLWCTVMLTRGVLQAAEQFELPECVSGFGSEVVLNPVLLDAMIRQAEPGGARPEAQHERLFIVTRYYLERSQGLALISRQEPAEHPLLLTTSCAPNPDAPAHIRTYFAGLGETENRLFIAYRDAVWPRGQQPAAQPGTAEPLTMAAIPAGPPAQDSGRAQPLVAFTIDIHEVSNAQYKHFMEAEGYTQQNLWSEAGWSWRQERQRQQPSYWDNDQLNTATQPVVGVTWYEAEAYCRWAGKTLPSQAQWDKALTGAATAQSPYGVQELADGIAEWTTTMHENQQIVVCDTVNDNAAGQGGCQRRYMLLPGIAANFVGFRCQASTP